MDQLICNTLHFQMKYLETFEDMKDRAEQELANWQVNSWQLPCSQHLALAPAPSHDSASGITVSTPDEIRANNEIGGDNEIGADAAFFDYLDALWRQGKGNMEHVEDSLKDFFDGDDECEVEHANEDLH